MDIIQRLQMQAEQVEVVAIRSESTRVSFEANRLKTSQVDETAGMAVRVVKNGRLGFAASSDMAALDKLVANALESASYGDAIPMRFPAVQAALPVQTYDRIIADLPVQRLVEMGQELVHIVRQVEPAAQVDVRVERKVQNVSIRNQTGADVSYERTPLTISVSLTRIQGDDVLMMFDASDTTRWEDDYTSTARRLCAKLQLAQTVTTISSGRMPVLFSPTGMLALVFPLNAGLNGKNVYSGISPLKGKLGETLFDHKLTLVDDATISGKTESAPYDDEAVPHRRNVLIEHGVVKGFLYDLKTAAQAGVESTGNGSRSLFSAPAPAETNVLIAGGDAARADIIAGIDEGLIVEDVLGLGQGNIISGAFSNPVALGFRIEKGKIIGRVKDVSIAGNIYDLLKNIAAVSRETEWVYGSFNTPSILLPEMNVVAKT